MPDSDRGAQTTESIHEAGPPRLHAPAGEASTALESGPPRLHAPTSIRRQRTSLAVPAFGLLQGEFVIVGSRKCILMVRAPRASKAEVNL
jgi:hypothetical protein